MSSHVNISGRPDPTKVMEMLSRMDRATQKKILQKCANMMPEDGDPCSQQSIRANWEKMKQNWQQGNKMKRTKANFSHVTTTTMSCDVKEDLPTCSVSAKSVVSFVPLRVCHLDPGSTHRGRYFVGRVVDCSGFWAIASGSVLLEDISGDVVEIAVYYSSLPQKQREAAQRNFSRCFALGREMGIVEPFYKIGADGTAGIRVDKPATEIVDFSWPKDLEQWKQLGNDFIKSCPQSALLCYKNALAQDMPIGESGSCELFLKAEICKVLTNLSLLDFQLGNFETSFYFSALAFALGRNRGKAAFRLAKALQSLGYSAEAAAFAKSCITDEALGASEKTALQKLVKSASTGGNPQDLAMSAASWADKRVLIWAQAGLDSLTVGIQNPEKAEASWLSYKEQGNEHFRKKDFEIARQHYLSALGRCSAFLPALKECSFVLSNKAAAWLQMSAGAKNPREGKKSSGTKMSDVESNFCTEGCLHSCLAVLLNRSSNIRGWMRWSKFLERLGKGEAAISLLEAETESLAEATSDLSAALEKELKELRLRVDSTKKVRQVNETSTEEQLRGRRKQKAKAGEDENEDIDAYICRMEALWISTRMMISKGGSKARDVLGPLATRECLNFCEEFCRSMGIPDGLDKGWARKVLYRAFLNARTHPWFTLSGWRNAAENATVSNDAVSDGNNIYGAHLSPEILFKRWHGSPPLEEFEQGKARPGVVIDRRHRSEKRYESRVRSNYVNCPSRGEILFHGTTHVSIGFNDLNTLLNCAWREPSEPEFRNQSARFVGLEMSEFNVAKTMVITRMLGDSAVPISSILQVWWSSVWTKETHGFFVEKVREELEVLESGPKSGSAPCYLSSLRRNKEVRSYLHHWIVAAPISCEEARRWWLDTAEAENNKVFGSIPSFKRRKDRLALSQHLVTGEVFGCNFKANNGNSVGSMTLWQCPAGAPPLEEDVIFNSFPLETLLEIRKQGSNKEMNIVALWETNAVQSLERTREMVISEKLSIEVYHGVVKPLSDPSGYDLIECLAMEVRPYTVSWSNVIDYFRLDDLHAVGRAISFGGDVVHYGYSMNWVAEVFGTNICDYQMMDDHDAVLATIDMTFGGRNSERNTKKRTAMGDAMREVSRMGGGKGQEETLGRIYGADEILTYPFFDNPMNATTHALSRMFSQFWVEHFLSKAANSGAEKGHASVEVNGRCFRNSRNGGKIQSGSTKEAVNNLMPISFPLQRIASQVYITWTYDANLRLQGVPEFDEHF